MHRIISILIIVTGFMVMLAKIYANSEPGSMPMLLIVVGVGWYCISRLRTQSLHK